MILIEVNRYVIKQLEGAIDKYNNRILNENELRHYARITEYSDIIEKALEDYLKKTW